MHTLNSSRPLVDSNRYLKSKNGQMKDKYSTLLRSQDSIENNEKLQLYLTQKNLPVESQFKESKQRFVRKGRLAFKQRKSMREQESGITEAKSQDIYTNLVKENMSRTESSKNVRRLKFLTQRGKSYKGKVKKRKVKIKRTTLKYLTNFVGSAYFLD